MPEKKTAPGCEFMFVHQEIVERVNAAMPAEETLFDLAELFKIFGDSTRIKILYVLFESEMCVCDIAQLLGMSQSAISHQLQVLKKSKAGKVPPQGQDRVLLLADSHVRTILGQGMEHVHRIKYSKGESRNEKNLQTHRFRLRPLRRQNGGRHPEDRRRHGGQRELSHPKADGRGGGWPF